MLVKIIDIHPDDAYYDDRKDFQGKVAECTDKREEFRKGFYAATLLILENVRGYDRKLEYNFFAIKFERLNRLTFRQKLSRIWRILWEQ